jgi:hypothetical protein
VQTVSENITKWQVVPAKISTKQEVIPMKKKCQKEASLSCVQSKLGYRSFLVITVVMLTARS